jgi:hypothetical protein
MPMLDESSVDIANSRHPDKDTVSVSLHRKRDNTIFVHLNIGTGKTSDRHANLTTGEAREVAEALLSYAEKLSKMESDSN